MSKREFPARDAARLGAQLTSAFKEILKGQDPEALRYAQALLDTLSHDLLDAASRADVVWLDRMRPALAPFSDLVEDYLEPELDPSQELLARALQVLESFEKLAEVTAPRAARRRVDQSESLRDVIKALHLYPQRFARTGQVAADVDTLSRSRVGQLLAELHVLGYTERIMATQRGGRMPLYRLSPMGQRLAKELFGAGLFAPDDDEALVTFLTRAQVKQRIPTPVIA